jgi:hypothetical protein
VKAGGTGERASLHYYLRTAALEQRGRMIVMWLW